MSMKLGPELLIVNLKRVKYMIGLGHMFE